MPPKKEKEEEEEKWVPWGPEDAADKDPVMLREPVTVHWPQLCCSHGSRWLIHFSNL